MRYLLIDEVRYEDAELAGMQNLVAALCRLEKSHSPEDIRSAVRHLADWLKAPEQLSLRRAFTVMLGRVLLPRRAPGQIVPELNDLQEVDAMLAETVQEWTKEWEATGHQKGFQEGRQEGEAVLLRHLLQKQFAPLPEWVAKKVQSADHQTIEVWFDRALKARVLDEVFVEPS